MPIAAVDPIVRRLREAEGYLELGLPEKALEILQSRKDWASVQFEASYLTGEVYRALEDYRQAIPALEHAAKLRSGDVHVALALGWCYKRSNKLAEAIDVLERASELHPDVPLLPYNLACYWSLAGNAEKSLQALGQAIKLAPGIQTLTTEEPDFDPIRDLAEFHLLIKREFGEG